MLPRLWSVDAWALVRPASAFRFIAAQPSARAGVRIACRRPLLLTLVLASVVSLCASGMLTARLVGPATLCWVFVPIVEVAALAAIVWRRQERVPLPIAIDAFFAGHAAWMLLLIGVGGALAFGPPALWWALITRVGLSGVTLVIIWSAYTDFCFFRSVMGAGRAAAWRDVTVVRLITWTTVFWIFAVPAMTPWGVVQEIVAALKDVL